MDNNISVVIQTHNEENNIEECIKSAQLLTDNILMVDTESSDKTVLIAKKMGVKIFSFPYSRYVEPARQFGMDKIKSKWVFILDADERITEELAKEVKDAIRSDRYSYYGIPRKNIFGKTRWLKHGGWWPDYQIRLISKSHFQLWPREIHSTPVIKGKRGGLKKPLIHYFHGDLETMVDKTTVFEDVEAELLFKAGRRASTLIFFRKFLGELYRRLVRNFGFLDGEIGIIETIYQAFSKTITYLYLYEKKSRSL